MTFSTFTRDSSRRSSIARSGPSVDRRMRDRLDTAWSCRLHLFARPNGRSDDIRAQEAVVDGHRSIGHDVAFDAGEDVKPFMVFDNARAFAVSRVSFRPAIAWRAI